MLRILWCALRPPFVFTFVFTTNNQLESLKFRPSMLSQKRTQSIALRPLFGPAALPSNRQAICCRERETPWPSARSVGRVPKRRRVFSSAELVLVLLKFIIFVFSVLFGSSPIPLFWVFLSTKTTRHVWKEEDSVLIGTTYGMENWTKIPFALHGCESKCKSPIHTLNPQANPYPRSRPKCR